MMSKSNYVALIGGGLVATVTFAVVEFLFEGAVDGFGFKKDHRVGVANGFQQQRPRVARGGGNDHLYAGGVRVVGLSTLAVMLDGANPAAVGHAYDHG